MTKHYCFVLDVDGRKLAPTSVQKGWFLIRKKRANLVGKYPMVIQLNKKVENAAYEVRLGIDDGSLHVGFGLVQSCQTRNKPVWKATLAHRKDVSPLMETRKGYRRYKRAHKRYRPARFLNRASSNRKGRLAPSILQKKQTIVRVVNKLTKWVNISSIHLENVAIDIRALTDGTRLYKWQYQQSNRLDENIRKAVILRDQCQCMECGKRNTVLEVHHIVPRRLKGSNTLGNLITLCSCCHEKTFEKEEQFIDRYQTKIQGKSLRLDYAQHVMQGKTWLQEQLRQIAPLVVTDGGTTANKRMDWSIEKSHSNDALVITDLEMGHVEVQNFTIKPFRRKRKGKPVTVQGFQHRDIATYTDTKGVQYTGYVTALYPDKKQINIQAKEKHLKRVNALKSKLVWRFSGLYFQLN